MARRLTVAILGCGSRGATYAKNMLKAPEKYKNLQVRVAGWNALFTTLSTKEQEAYIAFRAGRGR